MEASTAVVYVFAIVFIALLALVARVVLFADLPSAWPGRRAGKGGGQEAIERRLDELERRQASDIAGVRDEIREIRDSR